MPPFLQFIIAVLILMLCGVFIRLAITIYNIWMYKSVRSDSVSSRPRVGTDYWETSETANNTQDQIPPIQSNSLFIRSDSLQHPCTIYVQVHQENEIQNRSKYPKRFSNASVRFASMTACALPSAPTYSFEAENDLPPSYEEVCAVSSASVQSQHN